MPEQPTPGSRRRRRRLAAVAGVTALGATLATTLPGTAGAARESATATPIKHVVVIFQENVSFDHYFGTYPHAANTDGTPFHAAAGTPGVNGLTPALLEHNPNKANPQRLSHSEPLTCDQDHEYTDEQKASDRGLMDKFVEYTNVQSCAKPDVSKPNLVMDYYDGNTVTGMWNYAQHFAMNDNSFTTTFGPSTPGALNLVSGQTHGATSTGGAADTYGVVAPDAQGVGTVINDPDPTYDDCSSASHPTVSMSGRNVGDLLNARGVSWGWFQGGFRPTSTTGGKAVCGAKHQNVGQAWVGDYSAHHEPFEYYKSTANQHHVPPANVAEIGHNGPANHQYDLTDFDKALAGGNLPAVSFLKAAKYQDGHAGYSDPLDEQHFVVNTINALQRSKDWKDTAVVVAYDDSDGWYDHAAPTVLNSSQTSHDAYTGPGQCGNGKPMGGYQARCGYGSRVPLLVISPYARTNAVDSTLTDQSSVLRFIEDNWQTGRIGDSSFDALAGPLTNMFDFSGPARGQSGTLYLDPVTGAPVHGH